MPLTKIDCNFFRGESSVAETSSFVAVNAGKTPGSFVAAGAWAVRDGIGSQVASKLALEHFVEGVLQFYESGKTYTPLEGEEPPSEVSLQVLETAFRAANAAVFEFGTKLAAGGRMSASLIALVMEAESLAAARAGGGTAYLYRAGEIFSFFEQNERKADDPTLGYYIGAQPLVSVELAAVPLQESDTIFVFPCSLTSAQETALKEFAGVIDFTRPESCELLCRRLFGEDGIVLPFAIAARLGPEVIYLGRPLEEAAA
jgi:hypothetical protein